MSIRAAVAGIRNIFFCLIILLGSHIGTRAQDPVKIYIEKYKNLSVSMMHEYCIPASVILSIAIIESSSGVGKNCRKLDNHFGMKNRRGVKKTINGIHTAYRYYESDTASYIDFCEFVARKKFYQEMQFNKDYVKWIHALNRANYSMLKMVWVEKVIHIIRKYELAALDAL